MDVGSQNFNFTLDKPEKKARTIRYPQSTELHVSSLDRYVVPYGQVYSQTQTDAQLNFYYDAFNPSSNCQIQTKRALLYGYFNRIALTEFQLKYRVPTITAGVNDLVSFLYRVNGTAPSTYVNFTIAPGYYTTAGLADAIQAGVRATAGGACVTYTVTGPTDQTGTAATGTVASGFTFSTAATSDTWALTYNVGAGLTAVQTTRAEKFAYLIGAGRQAFGVTPEISPSQGGGFSPQAIFKTYTANMLQTDYIDIVSRSLTNYKESKDTNTNIQSTLGVIGRIYLSDFASVQGAVGNNIADLNVWGSFPLTFTKKWTIPNWSLWSPNQSIDKIDIQLLDMWGLPLFWNTEYNTEWQMTIVASE